MNLANLISISRVAILPIIIFLIYQETYLAALWAVALVFLAMITDIVDSLLIQKKIIGSFLDPFTDRIMIVTLLLVFTIKGSFSYLFLSFFIFRDLLSGLIRLLAARDAAVIRTDKFTQLMVSAQYFLVFALLLEGFSSYGKWINLTHIIDVVIVLFTYLSLILAMVSLIYYFLIYYLALKRRSKISRKIQKEKMIILANRKSRGYHDAYRRRLLRIFAKRRKARIIYLPLDKNMFKGIVNQIKEFKHIVIAGGDGSFESALNYHHFQKKSLGFFPLGGGNAFYSYFYKGKRFEYLRSRFDFQEKDLDILEVEWEKGKIQTTFMNLGLDSEVIKFSNKRTLLGMEDYIRGSWLALLKAQASYNFSYNIDHQKGVWKNCINVTLGKIPYYGYGIRSLPGKVNSNNNLVYGSAVINTLSPRLNKLLRLWALLLAALGIDKIPLVSIKGKEIYIKSKKPFALQAGGEFLGYSNFVKAKIIRKQKVLVI